MHFAQSIALPPPTATMTSQPCSAYTTAPASISSIRGLGETLVNSVHPRPAPSMLASTCCAHPARTTPGSETTSALVPPRLRPYCPVNSKAPTPKMISGAKNFRKFRESIMALRPSTIRLQVLRLTDGHAKYVELLSKADVFVFLVARFHLNPPICCSLSCWWRKAAVVAASAVILVVVADTSWRHSPHAACSNSGAGLYP